MNWLAEGLEKYSVYFPCKHHFVTPKALFNAAVKAKVKKVIQISALGVETTKVDFATSKKTCDEYLLSLPIDAVVLRPSLVYSAGSYRGTSLFRGLAGTEGVSEN